MPRLVRCIAAAALCAVGSFSVASASESSIACDGGIVAVGDTKVDVLGRCGEPALREARAASTAAVVVSGQPATVTGGAVSGTIEQWTYDFGPNRFVMLVTLEAGKVVLLERGGYGYGYGSARQPPAAGRPRACDTSLVRPGDVKLDLLARCGEPSTKDTRREQRPVSGPASADGTSTLFVSVEVEVWTYDLGPQRFISIVTLENGRVVSVERGGYGYAR